MLTVEWEFEHALHCIYISAPVIQTERPDPCNPSPCGQNALCTNRNGAAACTCIQDYFGDPYVACRPECTINADCPSTKACRNLHCIDPCPGLCGVNAQCRVINHIATCTCDEGYFGDPFTTCSLRPIRKYHLDLNTRQRFYIRMNTQAFFWK